MSNITAIPLSDEAHTCPSCQQLSFRLERGLKLHAQTACQLAQAEAKLVEAKQEIRQLRAQLAQIGGNSQCS